MSKPTAFRAMSKPNSDGLSDRGKHARKALVSASTSKAMDKHREAVKQAEDAEEMAFLASLDDLGEGPLFRVKGTSDNDGPNPALLGLKLIFCSI